MKSKVDSRLYGAHPRRDVQLGKTTINWKQRQLRFLHLVLAIDFRRISLGALLSSQTEHALLESNSLKSERYFSFLSSSSAMLIA